jgi:hypothetical protein
MHVLLLSMPDSFEHMPSLAIRMPNGALASLAGNLDAHHRVAVADLILVQSRVRETVERLVRELKPRKMIVSGGVLLDTHHLIPPKSIAVRPPAATIKPRMKYQRRPASVEAVLAETASTAATTLLLTSQWDTRLAAIASRNRIVGRQRETMRLSCAPIAGLAGIRRRSEEAPSSHMNPSPDRRRHIRARPQRALPHLAKPAEPCLALSRPSSCTAAMAEAEGTRGEGPRRIQARAPVH